MIQGEFEDAKCAKAVRSSHDDFGLVVEALDDTAGKLLARLEIVQQQLAVLTERSGELLHRLEAAAHDLVTPEVEELSGPDRRVVGPELLEVLLQQVGANRLLVVAEQVAKPNLPVRLLQHRPSVLTGFNWFSACGPFAGRYEGHEALC